MKRLISFSLLAFSFSLCIAQHPLNWSSFKWGHDTMEVDEKKAYVPRSAIFIPVQFDSDDRRYYLQLDLSSDARILLYSLPASIDSKLVNKTPASSNDLVNCYRVNKTLKGKLGSIAFTVDEKSYLLMRNKSDTNKNLNIGESGSIIGIIGLNYFMDKVLIIDFPRRQFTMETDVTQLPDPFRDTAGFVSTHLNNYRLSVPVTIADSTYNGFFYDSGSSVFDLAVSKKTWKKFTGRNGDEGDNVEISVTAWGRHIKAIGARMKYPIIIGKTSIAAPMVFYIPALPDFNIAFGCDGLFSNSSFYSKTILLDMKHNKLGIINEM